MSPNKTESQRSKSASLPSTPSKQSVVLKRPRKGDIIKFNRSNRKSKNCGEFYFKHSDTEPETGNTNMNNGNDWSSQDANSEIYSEDDQWVYSNGNEINGNNELSEEVEGLADASIQVHFNATVSEDAIDGSTFINQVIKRQ